ncbi:type I-E CRISPR-associated protein Cse1/CasA [Streptomyces sp. NPDC056056]|uniref:type I-E CRISPR-associated protein Cse1/CasA n=1 Tax=Streptomyces sp. NPDC056056 TaxID=3345698 RepID=UPI0035DA002B
MTSFDLLTRPWIPLLTPGGPARLSLREALKRAHEIRLACPPDEHTVLLRLLLSVFAAAARPADEAQWDSAWAAPDLDASRIGPYLDRNAGHFDLYDSTRPFWQCAQLTAGNREPYVLEPETWGSGAAQFASELLAPGRGMPPATAAVRLAMLQSWHPGGIQSGHPSDPATRGGRVYGGKPAPLSTISHLRITGSCLKDEILLNCPPGLRAAGDHPVWERDSPSAPMSAREPAGLLDLWTWPTRRVRLLPDENGTVTAVAVHDGDRSPDPARAAVGFDPGAALNGRGTPLAVMDAARQLLPWVAAALLDGDPGAGSCAVLAHVVAAAERGTLAPSMPIEAVVLRAEHTTSHRAALSGIVHLAAPIGPARTLADPTSRTALAQAALHPRKLQQAVTRAAATVLSLQLREAPSRPGLSVAGHLAGAWAEFTTDPHEELPAWHGALRTAAKRAAGSASAGPLMASARIAAAAAAALPPDTVPAHVPVPVLEGEPRP